MWGWALLVAALLAVGLLWLILGRAKAPPPRKPTSFSDDPDIPPGIVEVEGLAQVPGHIEYLLGSPHGGVLTISESKCERGFTVGTAGKHVFLCFTFFLPKEHAREVAVRARFASAGLAATRDSLYLTGRLRLVAFRGPTELDELVSLIQDILVAHFDVGSATHLTFRFSPPKAKDEKPPTEEQTAC